MGFGWGVCIVVGTILERYRERYLGPAMARPLPTCIRTHECDMAVGLTSATRDDAPYISAPLSQVHLGRFDAFRVLNPFRTVVYPTSKQPASGRGFVLGLGF